MHCLALGTVTSLYSGDRRDLSKDGTGCLTWMRGFRVFHRGWRMGCCKWGKESHDDPFQIL